MRSPRCHTKGIAKGTRSKEEDEKLFDFTQAHGGGFWRPPPSAAGLLRSCKSCRLRRISYQRPDVKQCNFSDVEDDLIVKLHALIGNRWSLIAGRLPGRTDDEIKNYWNSHLKRRLASMGIDPNNHRVNQCLSFHRFENSEIAKTNESSDSLSDDAESRMLPDPNLELTISPHESTQ